MCICIGGPRIFGVSPPNARLRMPTDIFSGLSSTRSCLTAKFQVFHLRGCLSLLKLPNTRVLISCYATVRLNGLCPIYRSHPHVDCQPCKSWISIGFRPKYESTTHSPRMVNDNDYALTPIPCDVFVHQCNAIVPLHFKSCPMYKDLYVDIIYRTLHRVPWTLMSNAHKSPYIH